MAERKNISKKLRFEVFKRDKFTCQYCGRMAPDVVLEVDHINPVKEGGTNDILNLITSCQECNRGKGARKLDDAAEIKAQQKQLKELSHKREQLEMLLTWRKELQSFSDQQVDAVDDVIRSKAGLGLSEYGREKIKRVINEFGLDATLDATETALFKYYRDGKDETLSPAIDRIGGICKQKSLNKNDPFNSQKAYIAGILKKRCNYYDNRRVWAMLNDVVCCEANASILTNIARECRNWTAFWQEVNGTWGGDW